MTTQTDYPLERLRRQFDDLFDRLWAGSLLPADQQRNEFRWDFGVTENDKEIVVRAEMPGFEPKEIDVRLENDVLTIQAEKEQKKDNEQSYLSFYRSVELPPGVDAGQVRAAYRNGVLELHIARPAASQARRIPVQGQQGAPAITRQEGAPAAASQQQQTGSKQGQTATNQAAAAKK